MFLDFFLELKIPLVELLLLLYLCLMASVVIVKKYLREKFKKVYWGWNEEAWLFLELKDYYWNKWLTKINWDLAAKKTIEIMNELNPNK